MTVENEKRTQQSYAPYGCDKFWELVKDNWCIGGEISSTDWDDLLPDAVIEIVELYRTAVEVWEGKR